MIYKIITDFQEDLDKILKHFQTEFVLLFYNNVVYIANKSEKETTNIKNFVSKVIKSNFYIQEINETNLKYEPLQVVEWCKGQFIRLDTLRFEAERQEELKAMLEFVNAVGENLEQLITQGKE